MEMLKPTAFSCSDSITWLHNNWYIPLASSLLYLVFMYFGQQWMKNRKPFNLKLPLTLWNSLLAAFSIIGASVCVPAIVYSTKEKGFIYTTCTSDSFKQPDSPVCFWVLLFVLSKIFELGNTFFVIFRKRPLILLHWYHHLSMVGLSWFTFSKAATGICHWSSSINFSMHSIMYSYYAATSAGIRFPVVIPAFITVLQILQMFIGSTVNFTAFLYRSSCPVDEIAAWAGVIALLSYAALFGRYFIKRYILGIKKDKKA
uniref:Elongation of very long chain fatty acids protein n=1 Tax=Amphimedon queenslandica TaxID=400682 RepID=A0A1X7VS77_AMPQE